jgi:hypothetical protein
MPYGRNITQVADARTWTDSLDMWQSYDIWEQL